MFHSRHLRVDAELQDPNPKTNISKLLVPIWKCYKRMYMGRPCPNSRRPNSRCGSENKEPIHGISIPMRKSQTSTHIPAALQPKHYYCNLVSQAIK